jgi:hypothetical protein
VFFFAAQRIPPANMSQATTAEQLQKKACPFWQNEVRDNVAIM